MWRATRVAADMANNIAVDAGIVVDQFDITNPIEPEDSSIVGTTTGDYNITCVPETEDFFEDVNNMPNNTKEGKRITGWDCGLTVDFIEVTKKGLTLALGAADVGEDGGVHPRVQYQASDFRKLWWLGDMTDENKLFVVAMEDTVSTGGINYTSTKNGKGSYSVEFTPHASIEKRDKVPMAFYILEKIGDTTTYTVTFDSDGGTSVTSQTVETGGKATEPTAPTKTGYTFGGWYKDIATTDPWDFDTDTVTGNTTLYAKWTED